MEFSQLANNLLFTVQDPTTLAKMATVVATVNMPITAATMLIQTSLFALTWLAICLLVRHHGPFQSARSFTLVNSRFYALVSFCLLLLILDRNPQHDIYARYAYHFSKLYEYIDILGVAAAKGEIDSHFGFHHLTTPWLTFVRVLPGTAGWRGFAAANAAHHVLVYAYFGGWEGVRGLLLWTGPAQLFWGMAVDAWNVWARWGTGEQVWRFIVSAGLLATYRVLDEMEMRRRERVVKAD